MRKFNAELQVWYLRNDNLLSVCFNVLSFEARLTFDNGGNVISKESAAVGWALLMYELEDAHEHLGNLIHEMETDPDFDEVAFRTQLSHIFSHLNRAWNRRDVEADLADGAWEGASQFPKDLDPI